MSAEATFWAWKLSINNPLAKLVLLRLADRAGDDHECWPSMNSVARETGMSVSSVKRYLGKLIEMGLVVSENQTRTDGSKTSNLYRLKVGSDRTDHSSVGTMPHGSIGPMVGSSGAIMNLPGNLPVQNLTENIPQSPSAPVVGLDTEANSTEPETQGLSTRDQSAEGAMPPREISDAPPRNQVALPGMDLAPVRSALPEAPAPHPEPGDGSVVSEPVPPKKTRRKVRGAGDPRFTPFRQGFEKAYLAKFGAPYLYNGVKDAMAICQILANEPDLDVFQLIGVVQLGWGNRSWFVQNGSKDIFRLPSVWNQLRTEFARLAPTPNLQDPHAF
jgi:hypothetical protein